MRNLIPAERIENKIYLIRRKKVMLDRDLAELYGVATAQLKKQVRRNMERFPEDFMFILNKKEVDIMVCQIGIPSKAYFGGAMEKKYDQQFKVVFDAIKALLRPPESKKPRIGFLKEKENQ